MSTPVVSDLTQMVHVTIRNVTGQQLELEVADFETSFDVKNRILAEWGLPVVCQELVLVSTVLADTQRFSEFGEEVELLAICSLRRVCAGLASSGAAARASALRNLASVRGQAGAVEAALECLEAPGRREHSTYSPHSFGSCADLLSAHECSEHPPCRQRM